MPITRAELKGQAYRLLMKTPQYKGAYQEETANDALQEAMDYVATKMFISNQGWLDKIEHITTVANTIAVPIPETWAMVKEVRYKYGDTYLPLTYDTAGKQPQYAADSGARQYACSYRIVDNKIYFNPPLAEGGTDYLQIEYTAFPKFLQKDNDTIEPQFNRCFLNFIKYRTATVLARSVEKYSVPWAKEEGDWFLQMQDLVAKLNMQTTQLLEYGD